MEEENNQTPEGEKKQLTLDEKTIILMRRCGHHLHRAVKDSAAAEAMLAGLSEKEKKVLYVLLKKVYATFKQS